MIQLLTAMAASSNTGATRYLYVEGSSNTESALTDRECLIAEAGTFRDSYVKLGTAPGVGRTWTLTLMKNGVAQAHVVTITGTDTSGTDTTNAITVAAGDRLTWRIAPSGTPAATTLSFAAEYEPTTANRAVWGTGATGGGGTGPSDSAVSYTVIGAAADVSSGSPWDATEANRSVVWAITATIKTLYLHVSTAPGGVASWTCRIVKNGVEEASSEIVMTGAATTASITGLNIALVPGDLLSLKFTPSGTPAQGDTHWGISYAPTTDGQWNISAHTDGATENFMWINNSVSAGHDATEANRASVAVGTPHTDLSVTAAGARMKLVTAPGVGNSRTLTLRKNSAASTVAVTISGTDTTGSYAGAALGFVAGDTWDWDFSVTGAPSASIASIAICVVTGGTGALIVSGTVVPNATEQEVRDGGQTIILTLTGGVTWEATMGDCNEITERLIDQLASNKWEALGWNNIVRGGVSYEDAVLADSPSAFWRLSDTTDTGPNSLTITTVGGGVTQDVTGLLTRSYNEAMAFDGINAGLTISDTAALQNLFDGGGAAEAVIRPLSDGEGDNGRIVSKGNVWALFVVEQSGGLVKLAFRQEFSTTTGLWQTAAGALALGARSHVAVVYNSSSVANDPIFYINGYEYSVANGRLSETSTPVGTRTTDVGEAVYIGGFGASVLRFRGTIDEVALYTASLTQAEVIDHLNAASNPFGLTCDDVVRTSDTVVTITMPAFPIYDITITETITVTAAHETTSSSADIVGTPTFDIITDGVRTIPYDPPPGPGAGTTGPGSGDGTPGPDPGGGTPDPGGGGDPNDPGGAVPGGGGGEPPAFEGGNGGLGPPAPGVNTDPSPDDWTFGLDGLDVGLGIADRRRGRLLRIEVAEISQTAE